MTVSYPLVGTLSEENWALIPSEPAVFNDMIKDYGIDEAKVEDLYTLDFEHLKQEKVHGLIVVSPCDENPRQIDPTEIDPDADKIVFTSQVVTNVCGTLALLAVLFNADINNKGPIIENFLQFTEGFTPINRGLCVSNSTEIRRIHDAYEPYSTLSNKVFKKSNVTSMESNSKEVEVEMEDVSHYTAYIFKNGYLWEIDGQKPYPIKHGACTSDTWLGVAESVLKSRLEVVLREYGEDRFSMMAVLENDYPKLKSRSDVLKANLTKFDKAMTSQAKTKNQTVRRNKKEFHKNLDQNSPEYNRLGFIWDELDKGNYEVKEQVENARTHYLNINTKIQTYEYNKKVHEEDATRQKFNYFPFINEIISIASKRGLVEDPNEVKTKAPKKRKTTKQPQETKEKKPAKRRKH